MLYQGTGSDILDLDIAGRHIRDQQLESGTR
jgi:hypothetical protein